MGKPSPAQIANLLEGDAPTFTDDAYHLGDLAPGVQGSLSSAAEYMSHLSQAERFTTITKKDGVDASGRYNLTLRPMDIGIFSTPSLRQVAVTARYMHDGSVATLAEAVEHEIYWSSLASPQLTTLTRTERVVLVCFLKTLRQGLNQQTATDASTP